MRLVSRGKLHIHHTLKIMSWVNEYWKVYWVDFAKYDSVIKDQIEGGIAEVVNEETKPDVVRRDKSPQG